MVRRSMKSIFSKIVLFIVLLMIASVIHWSFQSHTVLSPDAVECGPSEHCSPNAGSSRVSLVELRKFLGDSLKDNAKNSTVTEPATIAVKNDVLDHSFNAKTKISSLLAVGDLEESSPSSKEAPLTEKPSKKYFKKAINQTTLQPNADCARTSVLCRDGFVRNCVTGSTIGRVVSEFETLPVKILKGRAAETSADRRRSFQKVFDSRAWGHGWDPQNTGLNASGMGATIYWTQETVAVLHLVIDQLKQTYNLSRVRLLDVPCGDMAWMSRFLKTRDDVDYTGVDIVPAVIRHHRRAYAGQASWTFVLADVVKDGVDTSSVGSYDLVLCRTLLQHLVSADAARVLGHLSALGSDSQPTYLLVSTFAGHAANEELKLDDSNNPGRFRRFNLELPPISLTPPLCLARDGPPDAFEGWDHFIGLWKLPLRRVNGCWRPKLVEVTGIPRKLYSCVNWSLGEA